MSLLEEHTNFADTASRWLEANVPSRWKENRSALSEDELVDVRREWDRLLFEAGYVGISLPREFGGMGRSLRDEVLFYELAARAHAPESLGRVGKLMTIPTLVVHGSEWQRDRYIAPILQGDEVWCQGFSEPGAGSDLANVSATARRVEGGYSISGQKTWTSFALHADKCILLARTGAPDSRHRGLSYFLLDMNQPGVKCRSIRQISGGSHFAELFLDDAFVAERDRVGEEGDGWKIAMTTLTSERGGIEAITRYVEMRGDVDTLLSCCATEEIDREAAVTFETRVELIRWHVLKGLAHEQDPVRFTEVSSVLKVMWSELWQDLTAFAVQLPCALHQEHWRVQYLETRATTIYSGSNEIQRNIIAERVLGLPR